MRESTLLDDFKMYVMRSGNTMNQLIAVNVAAFILFGVLWVVLKLFVLDETLYNAIRNQLTFPASFIGFLRKPWTIITYQFLHADFFHIFFNMLVFLFAGRIFREYLGDKKLLSVYLIGGMAGGILFMLAYQLFPVFRGSEAAGLIGASASIMAILVAAATLLPRYTVFIFLIGPVQLVYVTLVLLLIDLLSLVGFNSGGHFAHLGGALFGFAYIKLLQNGTDIGAWLTALLDKIKSIGRNRLKPRIGYFNEKSVQAPRSSRNSRISEEEVDTILDKIARSGYDSLTQKEKDILFRASKEE